MATAALTFDILAKDRASKTFDNIGGKAEKAGSKLAAIGKIAGVAALGGVAVLGTALVSTFKGGFAELSANQKAMAQFSAGIKSTGGVAKVSSKQVLALADSIEAKTGTDGAAVVSGAALLATFTKVRNEVGKGNDVFNRATKAGVDLAARGFGSVEGNAVMLGKALNDPIKGIAALSRAGVTFTAEQKKTIKSLVDTGDTLGAQKIILEELEDQVGGSAEAYGKTLPGQIDRAKAAFEGVQESVAKRALPALTGLLDWVNGSLLPGLGNMADKAGEAWEVFRGAFKYGGKGEFDGWLGVINDIGATLSEDVVPMVQGVVKKVQDAFNAYSPDVTAFATKIKTGIVTGIGDFTAEVKTAIDTGDWAPVGESLGTALAAALTGAGTVAGKLTSALGGVIEKVDWGKLSFSLGKQVPLLLAGLALGILNFDPMPIFSFLGDHWFEVIMGVLTVAFLPAKVIGVFARILGKIPLVGPFLRWGLLAIKGFADKITGWVGGLIGRFATGFLSQFPRVTSAFGRGFELLRIQLFVWGDNAVAWVKRIPGRFQSGLGAGMEALGKFFGRAWTLLWDGVKRTSGLAIAAVAAVFLGLVGTLVTGAAKAFGWVPGIGPKLKEASAKFASFKDEVNRELRGIKDKTVNVSLRFTGAQEVNRQLDEQAQARQMRAGDGPGRGGKTLARLQGLLAGSGAYVTSTYRTPARNRAIGGSPTSYHMDRSNPAVDIGGPTSVLNRLHSQISAMGGWRELIWQAPGHYDHIHVADEGGVFQGPGMVWMGKGQETFASGLAAKKVADLPVDLSRGGRSAAGPMTVVVNVQGSVLSSQRDLALAVQEGVEVLRRQGYRVA